MRLIIHAGKWNYYNYQLATSIPMASSQIVSHNETHRRIGRPPKSAAAQCMDELWVMVDSENPDGMQLSDFTDLQASVLCTLSIPNRLLYHWYRQAGSTSSSHTYVRLLNEKIKAGIVSIKDESTRIKKLLLMQSHKLAGKVAKAKGRGREQLLRQTYTMFVVEGEAESIRVVRKEGEEKVLILQNECELNKAEVARSKEEIGTLLEEMANLASQPQQVFCSGEPNRGRIYEDMSSRQARRKLSAFTNRAQDVLWFADTFGLIPEYLQVRKVKSG